MKKFVKLIGVTMAVCFIASLASCVPGNADDSNGGKPNPNSSTTSSGATIEYELDGDSYTLVKMSDKKKTSFEVPATYEGKPVTAIAEGAFANCNKLTSIVVANSVTSIGLKAFTGCGNLTSLTVPFVGKSADATNEKALLGYMFGSAAYTGGMSVDQYYSTAAEDMSTYYIPANLVTLTVTGSKISSYALNHCGMIKTLALGENVAEVGENAFKDTAFTSVYVDSATIAAGLTAETAYANVLASKPTLYVKKDLTAATFLDSFYQTKSEFDANGVKYNRYGFSGEIRLEAELAQLTTGLSIDPGQGNKGPATSGGYCVGGFDSFKEGAGMTYKFTSDIATEAIMRFTLNPRGCEDYCADTYTITLNGVKITSDVQFVFGENNTPQWWWYNWETYEIATVTLQAGENVLEIVFHGNYGEPGSDRENTVDNGHNFDYVSFETGANISWAK